MSIFTFFNDPRSSFFDEDFQRSIFDDAWTNHSRALQRVPSQKDGSSSSSSISRILRPRLDLHEGPDNTLTATFELPGLKKEDVSIEVHDNRLTISGQVSTTNETKSDDSEKKEGSSSSGTWHIRERQFGKFSRTLQLPTGVEADKIKATHADGILTVTFPKAAPEQEPKKITIS